MYSIEIIFDVFLENVDYQIYLSDVSDWSGRWSLEARRKDGTTPLYCAAFNGKLETVKYLLLQGAHINDQDVQSDRGTPLLGACCHKGQDHKGQIDVVKHFLEVGADIDAQDRVKRTPLHWASYYGHTNMVRFLLEAGANQKIKNLQGKTAMDLARDDETRAVFKEFEMKDRDGRRAMRRGAAEGGKVTEDGGGRRGSGGDDDIDDDNDEDDETAADDQL